MIYSYDSIIIFFYYFLLIKQDILYILVCFLGFCAAGVLGVFPAMDWSQIISNINRAALILDPLMLTQPTVVFFESIRNSLAAAAVSKIVKKL